MKQYFSTLRQAKLVQWGVITFPQTPQSYVVILTWREGVSLSPIHTTYTCVVRRLWRKQALFPSLLNARENCHVTLCCSRKVSCGIRVAPMLKWMCNIHGGACELDFVTPVCVCVCVCGIFCWAIADSKGSTASCSLVRGSAQERSRNNQDVKAQAQMLDAR